MHPLSHRKRLRGAEKWTRMSPCLVPGTEQDEIARPRAALGVAAQVKIESKR